VRVEEILWKLLWYHLEPEALRLHHLSGYPSAPQKLNQGEPWIGILSRRDGRVFYLIAVARKRPAFI
jgi:hypothetical protein